MLANWLYFLGLGLLLAYPLARLLRWAKRRGFWRARPLYLRPYRPAPAAPADSATSTQGGAS